jgi:hypothetical protein
MKLPPLESAPTESISAIAAAITRRHNACLALEADFDRQAGRRRWNERAMLAEYLRGEGGLSIKEVIIDEAQGMLSEDAETKVGG